MIKIKKINLLWAEGKAKYDKPRTFDSFKEANSYLISASGRVPKAGGYDKHKIVLEWEDGSTFTGRWDVKYNGDDTNIKKHIEEYMNYLIKSEDSTLQKRKEAQEFLEKYALEDEVNT